MFSYGIGSDMHNRARKAEPALGSYAQYNPLYSKAEDLDRPVALRITTHVSA